MLAADRSALICDLAETYGIFDMYAIPVGTLAILAAGLRGNARIKMKLSGMDTEPGTVLLAAAVDRLSLLVWANTKDGVNGRNRPKSIVESLVGAGQEDGEAMAFGTAEDFREAWAQLTGGNEDGD